MIALRSLLLTSVAVLGLTAGCGGVGKSQTQLRSAVDAKKPTLDSCYEDALTRNEKLAGSMTLWVHVDEKSGKVSAVEVETSTVDDPALTTCIQDTLVGLAVDPKPKANLKVEYQLELSPQPPSES